MSEKQKQARRDEEDLPVFVKWMEFLEWLLAATAKFPAKTRFSFGQRIEGIALDVVEDLVDARYSREKRATLRRANLRLEKLRVLLRLSHRMRYLSHEGYAHASKAINECGKMLGGWIRQQEGGRDETPRLPL